MLAVCSVACCIAGGAQFVEAKADDYGSAVATLNGAYVRVDTSSAYHNGILFQATVDAQTYGDLEGSETATRTVDYGMVIVPLDYKTTYGDFTKENLFGDSRKYYIDGVTEAADGLKKLGGGYVSKLEAYETDDTKMLLEGSLLNIDNSQLTREFVGVPYICITDGATKEYHVGSYGGDDNARSMVYVAQRGIQRGTVTDEQKTYLNEHYLTYKDDAVDVASKQYTYTVEHIALDPEGNVVETLETVEGAKTTLGETVSASENTYANYTYDAAKSTASDIIYANNRTTLKLYYVQDYVNVTFSNSHNCVITPDDEKYAGKSYALKADGLYHFTVNPPADFDKDTQQIYGFVNGELWIANGAEGKYAVDLSTYANGAEIKLGCSVGEFKPTLDAGQGDYTNLVSVTQSTESDNSVLYTYANKTPGLDTGTNRNWGESGLFFDEVYNTRTNANAQQNKFFNKGYKYIRFDVKFADNTTGYNVRVGDSTYQMEFGSAYNTSSGIVKVFNRANQIVTTINKDTWYTFYVQPTKGQKWVIWPDGGSEAAPAVTYISNVQYLEQMPTNIATLVMHRDYNTSLEYKVDGDFAGAWKYTNETRGWKTETSKLWGEAGMYFDEVYNPHLGNQSATFFSNNYQYISFDFYAEESVHSINLQNAWTAGSNYVQFLQANTSLPTGTIFAIYDADGKQVDEWTHNTWYTLVIKPSTETPTLRIQTNAETITSAAPVMYVKNISYSIEAPFAN